MFKLNWRYVRYVFTIALVATAFFVIYSQFKNVYYDIPRLFKQADKSLLLLLALFQMINYLGDGMLSRLLLGIAGFKVGLKDTLKIAILGVVGNHVAPFVGGAIVTFYSYKKLDIPSAMISFLLFCWSIFVWSIYVLFFVLSLFLLPSLFFEFFTPQVGLSVIFVVILLAVLLFFLFRKKGKYLVSALKVFSRCFNKIASFFSSRISLRPHFFEKFFADFHQYLVFLKEHKRKIPRALLYAFLFYIGDILTLYFSFLVFGYHPNPVLLVFGYTISLVLTLFTLMPGTPGVMEASLVFVFIKAGFPADVALFASLLFRIFSYWLPLPVGVVSYWRLRKIQR